MRKDDDVHVVMIPWSAFGHLIPFFNLSIALAEVGGIHVSFISTPRNIKRLPKVPPHLAHLIKIVEFPLPDLDDKTLLPDDAEATVDIPTEKQQYLKVAYDLLQEPIKNYIADEKPEWIVVDIAPHWAVDIAEAYHIPMIYYCTYPAAATAFSIAATAFGTVPEIFTLPVFEMLHFPSTLVYKKYESLQYLSSCYQDDASGASYYQRGSEIIVASQVIAIRSCKEFEGWYLDALHKVVDKPIIPIGLLPHETISSQSGASSFINGNQSWQKMFKWLDQQKPRSILFVGFGSESKPSKDQIDEIAYGLELSGLSFIWILQKPSWSADDVDPLPEGFGSRMVEKGMVHIGWAPQKEILAHPCIGGTLVQGGWGTIIECLQHGHIVIVLPFIYDQGFNARVLMEKGLGIEVERNDEDGSFTRNDIAKALTYAMVSEEGEEIRARAREASSICGDRKLHDSYIASFVEFLKNNKNKSMP